MRRAFVIATTALATLIVAAPGARAATQTAHAGDVTASFSFKGKFPNYSGERLEIAQGGNVFYDGPVSSKFCTPCAPGSSLEGKGSSVHIADLEHSGQPDVVLDLYTASASSR